jgi:hypothetical protein
MGAGGTMGAEGNCIRPSVRRLRIIGRASAAARRDFLTQLKARPLSLQSFRGGLRFLPCTMAPEILPRDADRSPFSYGTKSNLVAAPAPPKQPPPRQRKESANATAA